MLRKKKDKNQNKSIILLSEAPRVQMWIDLIHCYITSLHYNSREV